MILSMFFVKKAMTVVAVLDGGATFPSQLKCSVLPSTVVQQDTMHLDMKLVIILICNMIVEL